MTAKTRAANKSAILASIASNGTGAITGPILRTIMTDLIDSVAVNGEMAMSDITGLVEAIASIPDTTALAATVAGHTSSIGTLNSTVATHASQIAAALGGQTPTSLVSGGVRVRADPNAVYVFMPTFADNAAAVAGGLFDGQLYITAAGDVRAVTSGGGGGGGTPNQSFTFDFEGASINPNWYGAGVTLPDNGFSQIETVVAGSTMTRDTSIKFAGAASVRCFCPAKTTSTTPKSQLSREGWFGQAGSTMETTMELRVTSGPSNFSNLFFYDIEINGDHLGAPEIAGNFFGIRIALNATGGIRIDREFTDAPDPGDDTGRNIPITFNAFVTVKIDIFFHPTNGSVKVSFDGVNVFTATNLQTIPSRAQLENAFGLTLTSAPAYAKTDYGLTANGSATQAFTIHVDSINTELFL